jgi:hypothetical protein
MIFNLLGLEPLHGVLLGEPVGESNMASLPPPVQHIHTGPAQHHIEVHAVDTNAGVVPSQQKCFNPLDPGCFTESGTYLLDYLTYFRNLYFNGSVTVGILHTDKNDLQTIMACT